MKKYTHAWLAFKAIERLDKAAIPKSWQKYVDSLLDWFSDNRDSVINGAWYPDAVIKDMASSHVYKMTPDDEIEPTYGYLPSTYGLYLYGNKAELKKKGYQLDPDTNLPDRCEAIAHSIIDNLKMQESEPKGSSISPTDNHIATLMFMLSHYIADAHMPLHCDSRPFSSGANIHGKIESEWEDMVKDHFEIDYRNERFFYDQSGYPILKKEPVYDNYLYEINNSLSQREFFTGWGRGNGNVWDFMHTLCEYSYLMAYCFLPVNVTVDSITTDNWQNLSDQSISFNEMSQVVLADAIDSIARVWLRIWRKYQIWLG